MLQISDEGQHRVRIQITHLIDGAEIDQTSRTISTKPDIDICDMLKAVAGGLTRGSPPATKPVSPPDPNAGRSITLPRPPATALSLSSADKADAGALPPPSLEAQAWIRFISDAIDDGTLHESLKGLEPMQIIQQVDVKKAVRYLDLDGVSNPLQLVLEFGPLRCLEVRQWAAKVRQTQGTTNLAGLIASTIKKSEPKENKQEARA